MAALVRPATPADAAEIERVERAAFGRDAEATLVDSLRAGGYARIELVGEATGGAGVRRVCGHVLFTELPLASGGRPLLALAPLAVEPAHQRRGMGTALAEAGLAAADAEGWPAVVVLGDPAYYGRFGFRPARLLGITGPYGDGDAFQALRLSAYGGERGEVRYPAPLAGV